MVHTTKEITHTTLETVHKNRGTVFKNVCIIFAAGVIISMAVWIRKRDRTIFPPAYIFIFISQIVEILPDLWYSINQVGHAEGFRLIMEKPIIDDLAVLKESVFKWSGPNGPIISNVEKGDKNV